MTKRTCKLCKNSPDRWYPLCNDCYRLRDEGIVNQCDCKTWHYTADGCPCCTANKNKTSLNKNISQNMECLTCTEKISNGFLCKECYKTFILVKNQIDKNMDAYELRDYYYNLRAYIARTFWSKNMASYFKLLALATIANDIHKDNSLISRIQKDICELMGKKKESADKLEPSKQKEVHEKDKLNNPGYLRALDGHFVRSEGERTIDDILYNENIVHTYQKKVLEITERTVTADWFIPVVKKSIGIYIEFWGMDGNDDYDENQKEKQELYTKHQLKLIEIFPDDLKKDSQTLYDNLVMQISKFQTELFKQYNQFPS